MDGSKDDGFGTIAKVLSGGLAAVTAAAATLGAATGGVAFLLRNAPIRMWWALALAFVAVLAAGLVTIWPPRWPPGPRWWFRAFGLAASALLLGTSLWLVFRTQSDLLDEPSRPVIAAEWATVGGSLALKLNIEADALARTDQLYAAVVAVGRQTSPTTSSSSAQAPTAPFTIYAGNTGPDPDGRARQVQQIVVPTQIDDYTIESLQVAAVVFKKSRLESLLNRVASPSPTPTSAGSTPSPSPSVEGSSPAPRIISLNCDGGLTTADATTGIQEFMFDDPTYTPACLTLSAIP